MWDESEWGSPGFEHQFGLGRRRTEERGRTPPTPGAAVAGFILIIVMTLVFAMAGAPGAMIGLMFLVAVVSLIGGLAASKDEQRKMATAAREEAEHRERLVEDITRSVKQSMNGMIKVRCRYCGGLNDEHDEKCESCGAPL